MQCRQQSAPPWDSVCTCRGSQATPLSVPACILLSCSCARNKCQIKSFCRTNLSSFSICHELSYIILLQHISSNSFSCYEAPSTWQMRATECESSRSISKAGVGRDRMRIGNAIGRSICILQAVLLANAGTNEFCPWMSRGSRQLSTAHSTPHPEISGMLASHNVFTLTLRRRHYRQRTTVLAMIAKASAELILLRVVASSN